ncbi:TetR/AcrR family transcriptional regulator [bacterium]|nr:TetR/AcrR family transcriptional regulator [bacterium]MBU1073248.1 TetR/AcrR family transcriptional regulator [bacterium]MBU1676826.1 TetR/AcrR family transcriptional regulator [bacterium]
MTDTRDTSKRVQIIAAGEPIFERFGFRKTTVGEICREAGVSKRTFYELFSDKADLLMQMLMHVISRSVSKWEEALTSEMTAIEKLERYIDGYEEMGRNHPVFHICLHEPDVKAYTKDFMKYEEAQAMIEVLQRVVAEGIRRGELREMDPPTIVWIIGGLLDSMYYVFPELTSEPSAFENETLSRELRAFILNGIRNLQHESTRREQ